MIVFSTIKLILSKRHKIRAVGGIDFKKQPGALPCRRQFRKRFPLFAATCG